MTNRIVTKLRNRLRVKTIDILLRLRLSSLPYNQFDYGKAWKYYTDQTVYSIGKGRKRRKIEVEQRNTVICAAHEKEGKEKIMLITTTIAVLNFEIFDPQTMTIVTKFMKKTEETIC